MMTEIRPYFAVGALLALSATAACDDSEGSPSSLVSQPRILAVQAEPPVVSIGGESALVPLLAGVDAATEVEWSVRACNPWKIISDPTADCGPADSIPLDRESFSRGEGAWLRTADLLAAFPPPDWALSGLTGPGVTDPIGASNRGGEPPECGDAYESVDAYVVFEAVIAQQTRLLATKRVRVTTEPVVRMNPVIEAASLDDQLNPTEVAPGTAYTLVAAPRQDSLDLLCGPDGVGVLESVRVYIYASSGILADPYFDVEYTAEGQEMADMTMWTTPDQGPASLWLVAIDGDGGTGWHQIDVAVNP